MRKPLIGLATGLNKEETYLQVNNGYMRALENAGALPVVLPLTSDQEMLEAMIEQMDGILVTGGGDIDPAAYGELTSNACGPVETLRDAMEIPLIILALQKDKPILGICRGFQSMNVALGGTLYQDLPTDRPQSKLTHRQKQPERFPAHTVDVEEYSLLAEIAGTPFLHVNSLHHQGVKELAPLLRRCAVAPDGLIESFEYPEHPFFLGVQWHPERMWQNDNNSMKIFKAFVEACRIRP